MHLFKAWRIKWNRNQANQDPSQGKRPQYCEQLMGRGLGKEARDSSFTLLPTTDRLGLPLEYISIAGMHTPADQVGMGQDLSVVNHTLVALSADFDPASPMFGRPRCESRGQYIIDTVNGDDVEKEHLEVVEAFLKARLEEVIRLGGAEKVGLEDRKKIAGKITPEAFKEFFAEYATAQGWTEVTCPVG